MCNHFHAQEQSFKLQEDTPKNGKFLFIKMFVS